MLRSRSYAALAIAFGLVLGTHADDAWARGKKKPTPTKPAKAPAKPAKTPAKPAVAAATPEQKKAMAELMGPYNFNMTRDDVIAQLTKQIDERYAEQIKATSDVMTQDRIRKDKQKEITRVKQSLVEFDGTKSGWDVSLIDQEFAQNTGESMLVYWENDNGKNQRRFFFFHDGRLWKMFISFDTKQLAAENRNFGYFVAMLEQRYGKSDMEDGYAAWVTPDFEVRAVDKMNFYGALGLLIQDPKQLAQIAEVRKAHAPEAKAKDNIIEVIKQKGDASDNVNLDENSDAVNAIINGSK
ncbi:MAG TPA: hypothetical protein VHE35_19815 [Kofleriaceae bacterium]|nr:hypothetical protein [Kofleriaceae bacterium]